MRPEITADGLRFAVHWIVNEPNPKLRGMRATVFNFCLYGLHFFPGCSNVTELCRHQRIPRSTFYALADELAAYGLRLHDPRARPMDNPESDNALRDDDMHVDPIGTADNGGQW
jgi:hypothetical protein